jgi:hypothetical protein
MVVMQYSAYFKGGNFDVEHNNYNKLSNFAAQLKTKNKACDLKFF